MAAFPRRAVLPDPSATPEDEALSCENDGLINIFDAGYWRKLCPRLHVDDKAKASRAAPFKLDKAVVKDLKQQLDGQGVVQVRPSRRHAARGLWRRHHLDVPAACLAGGGRAAALEQQHAGPGGGRGNPAAVRLALLFPAGVRRGARCGWHAWLAAVLIHLRA
jgi:hypothetical protein